jgi:acetyl-CoA carboxylase biotin carboxylase subunit
VIKRLGLPGGPGVRLDSAMFRGLEVTPHYDSMLGKLIVHGNDRAQAMMRMKRALRELRIVGVATSLPVALRAIESEEFESGNYDTSILATIDTESREHREVAMLAAAAARFLAMERVGAGGAAAGGDEAEQASAWAQLGRRERLWRSAR